MILIIDFSSVRTVHVIIKNALVLHAHFSGKHQNGYINIYFFVLPVS